jgi:hypothetical protein
VAAFAVKVENDPSFVTLLDVSKLQVGDFGPTESAANQNCDDGAISFTAHGVDVRRPDKHLYLVGVS